MNKTQMTYIIAKAAYEAAADEKFNRLHPYANLLDSDETIEAYTDLEIKFNDELNCDELRAAYRKAENDMIEWAMNKVSKSRHFNSKHEAAYAEVKANLHKPSIRSQMVDISLRLA